MTHYVAKHGPFETAFLEMPEAVSLPWLTASLPDNVEKQKQGEVSLRVRGSRSRVFDFGLSGFRFASIFSHDDHCRDAYVRTMRRSGTTG